MNLLISAGYVVAALLCALSYYKGYGRGFKDATINGYRQTADDINAILDSKRSVPKMNPANGYQPLDDIETLPPGFVDDALAKIRSITAKPCEICDRLIDCHDKTCQHPKNGYCQISLNNAISLKKFN